MIRKLCRLIDWTAFLVLGAARRASEFLRDYDGSVIQMRMAYSAVAHFLVQWTDCRLAGALGLLKIMIYKVKFARQFDILAALL